MAKEKFSVGEKARFNVYLPVTMANKVDEFATEFGINRSAMISVIIKQYIDQQEVLKLGRVVELQEELQNLISTVKNNENNEK